MRMLRVDSTASRSAGALSSGQRRRLLAGALLPWVLGACGDRKEPMRLVGQPWPAYEPMFLARTLGYMPPGVELQESNTGQESIQLIYDGRVDGVMLTLDEVLRLRDQGVALQIVLVFDVSRGADMLLARPGMRDLAALRNQRVGVEDSTLGALMLTLILEKAGLQRKDVSVQPIPYDEHETAWDRNYIDALITYEPLAGRLLARGARLLLSTRQLPDTIFDVLAMRSEVLDRHADGLRACLAAYFKALTYLRQNPWDVAYRVAPRLQVSAEGLIDSLRGLELPDRIGNLSYLAGTDSALLKAVHRLSPILQQAGLLQKPVNTERLLSSLYLPTS
ncbi:MAG: ABC transporter substrate-binding protein [Burkholderiales bacterium]|nr:ABC transporter substrate-binding protein [Burkholderiales bacterium]